MRRAVTSPLSDEANLGRPTRSLVVEVLAVQRVPLNRIRLVGPLGTVAAPGVPWTFTLCPGYGGSGSGTP
jgi:hypothetical protein